MATINTKSESEQVGESIVNQIAALLGEQSANINSFVTIQINQLQTELKEIQKQMATQGATLTQVQASLTALQTEVATVGTDIAAGVADIAALGQTIATLQAAGGASPEDLANLNATIQGITSSLTTSADSLAAVLPPPSTPAPAAPSGS